MKNKADTNQQVTRRPPQQERARQKIELIFEATIRLLEQKAPADISTNAIAKLAGISIGTLYQYFPDKDAVFQALKNREFEELSQGILDAVQTHPPRPGGRIASVLGAVLDAYGGREIAHRRLMLHSIESGSAGLLGPLLERLAASFSERGIAGPGGTISALSRTDAFVLTHAVGGVIRAAVGAHGNGGLDREALERSLTRLVLGFVGPAVGVSGAESA